jgi:hypothetical protein
MCTVDQTQTTTADPIRDQTISGLSHRLVVFAAERTCTADLVSISRLPRARLSHEISSKGNSRRDLDLVLLVCLQSRGKGDRNIRMDRLPSRNSSGPTIAVRMTTNPMARSSSSESHSVRLLERVSMRNDLVSRNSSRTTQSMRVTRMLVLVSTCFLLLNAPAHFLTIGSNIYSKVHMRSHQELHERISSVHHPNPTNEPLKSSAPLDDLSADSKNVSMPSSLMHEADDTDDQLAIHFVFLALLFAQWISYASYSINFFLYCFSGVVFRTGLRQWIQKLRKP